MASALVSVCWVHSSMGVSPCSRLEDKQELTKSDLGMMKENMDIDRGQCQKCHEEVNITIDLS